ncbi:MAG TPA: Asp23/Gls24 family envelope stress response protein [Nocardioidaceae bacterium]|jgi:uncharacterized alkaline shock family protein YloU|nr:Asp23/Gls24 family envelope stress response protein [Nocardioidaceae bacterium]
MPVSSPTTPPSSDLATSSPGPLQSDLGKTSIADRVVQKIVGLAAREVPGIYDLGGGAARTLGAIRERIPGSSQTSGQGVTVEVGQSQAAVDLEVVTEYGMSIVDVAKSVRRNVISAVEGMTGLQVTEVNLSVNDIHLPGDDQEDSAQPARVQ